MTKQSKRIQAINGDMVSFDHPAADLSRPMSSFISIASGPTVHQAVSRPTAAGVDFSEALATASVAGGDLQVLPAVDNNETGAATPRFDAVWTGDHGVLMIGAYGTVQAAVDLVASLGISTTPLGVRLSPTGSTRFVSYPTVVVETPGLGLLETVPLTNEVMAQLPDWAGTPTTGGDLYAGSLSRSTGYLTLVSATARTQIMVREQGDIDAAADSASHLQVTWRA
jgi:hypothetical protein